MHLPALTKRATLLLGLVLAVVVLWGQAQQLKKERQCRAPVQHRGFLTPGECEAVIRAANTLGMQRSEVVGIGGNEVSGVRTSSQRFIPLDHPAVAGIVDKAEALLGVPRKYFEEVQVVRYDVDQRYEAHYDSDERTPVADLRGDTLLMYLNAVPDGGETEFPKLGLVVQPEQGKAIHWKNVDSAGHLLPCAFHGGRPVRQGAKWICTVWARLRAQG